MSGRIRYVQRLMKDNAYAIHGWMPDLLFHIRKKAHGTIRHKTAGQTGCLPCRIDIPDTLRSFISTVRQ